MMGKATLFPNTADAALFDDARDAEVNALIAAIPKDRNGRPPEPERIFGSLPVSEAELATVSIPGLASDLEAVHTAWRAGHLRRAQRSDYLIVKSLELLGGVIAAVVVFWLMRRRTRTA
jgi:hypothetical protein